MTDKHVLNQSWTLWGHLPHDTNWGADSYINLCTFDTVEELLALDSLLEERLVKNCMLFLMRNNISPTWEDKLNRTGGCFSYKIPNKFVKNVWTLLSYTVVGETSTKNQKLANIINGITISPKKNFCIVKIWTNTCSYKNPDIITTIPNMDSHGCLFKKHIN